MFTNQKVIMLFWIFTIINIIFLVFLFMATSFRSSFGAGIDFNVISIILVIVVLIASLMLHFIPGVKKYSAYVAMLPVCLLVIWYLVDKVNGK